MVDEFCALHFLGAFENRSQITDLWKTDMKKKNWASKKEILKIFNSERRFQLNKPVQSKLQNVFFLINLDFYH